MRDSPRRSPCRRAAPSGSAQARDSISFCVATLLRRNDACTVFASVVRMPRFSDVRTRPGMPGCGWNAVRRTTEQPVRCVDAASIGGCWVCVVSAHEYIRIGGRVFVPERVPYRDRLRGGSISHYNDGPARADGVVFQTTVDGDEPQRRVLADGVPVRGP